MVKRIGYILAFLLISTISRGQDSVFVFKVSSLDPFFDSSYKENRASSELLTKAIASYYDEIMSKERAFMISGEKESALSVQSYFSIYEGLNEEHFTYAEEAEITMDGSDYLVIIELYKTGYEPDVIRRKKRKALSKTKVDLTEGPEIKIERDKVESWNEQFVPTRRPLFLVKTNLLNDLAITPNIEFDIPVARHWSIAAEFNYGWWLKRDNSFCWQIEYGGVDVKYWIKPTSAEYNSMDKWWVGVFYNLGIYDFQFKASDGVQGRFNVMAGASFGYVYSVNDYLSFDFSLGVGYMSTIYQKYYTFNNVIVKSGSPVRMGLPCPKAEISLSFIIFKHNKKGGEI